MTHSQGWTAGGARLLVLVLLVCVCPLLAAPPAAASAGCDQLTISPGWDARSRPAVLATLPTSLLGEPLPAAGVLVTQAGRPVSVAAVDRVPAARIDAAIAVDTSDSVSDAAWRNALAAASSFVQALPRGARISVVSAGGDPQVLSPLSADHGAALRALRDPDRANGHAIMDGLAVAIDSLQGAPSRVRHILLVAGGPDDASDLDPAVIQAALQEARVWLDVVDVGESRSLPSLGVQCPARTGAGQGAAAGRLLAERVAGRHVIVVPDARSAPPVDVRVRAAEVDTRAALTDDPPVLVGSGDVGTSGGGVGAWTLLMAFMVGLAGLGGIVGLLLLGDRRRARLATGLSMTLGSAGAPGSAGLSAKAIPQVEDGPSGPSLVQRLQALLPRRSTGAEPAVPPEIPAPPFLRPAGGPAGSGDAAASAERALAIAAERAAIAESAAAAAAERATIAAAERVEALAAADRAIVSARAAAERAAAAESRERAVADAAEEAATEAAARAALAESWARERVAAAERALAEAVERAAADRAAAAEHAAAEHAAAEQAALDRAAALREAAERGAALREAAEREAALLERAEQEAAEREAAQRRATQREVALRAAELREAALREAARERQSKAPTVPAESTPVRRQLIAPLPPGSRTRQPPAGPRQPRGPAGDRAPVPPAGQPPRSSGPPQLAPRPAPRPTPGPASRPAQRPGPAARRPDRPPSPPQAGVASFEARVARWSLLLLPVPCVLLLRFLADPGWVAAAAASPVSLGFLVLAVALTVAGSAWLWLVTTPPYTLAVWRRAAPESSPSARGPVGVVTLVPFIACLFPALVLFLLV